MYIRPAKCSQHVPNIKFVEWSMLNLNCVEVSLKFRVSLIWGWKLASWKIENTLSKNRKQQFIILYVHTSFSALSQKLFHQFLSNLAEMWTKYTYIFCPNYKVKGQTARSQFRKIFCSHQFFGFISQIISSNPVKLGRNVCKVYIHILPQL